jgi:tRNA(adenine34) deaminase
VYRQTDERFMRMAIKEARIGNRTPGAGEVGCVMVREGKVGAQGHNEVDMSFDPTAHATIVTLRRLGKQQRSSDFSGCTVYCTLHCCGMCTMACLWAKVGRIVFGASRNDVHSMYFEERHFNTADFIRDAFKGDIEVVGGILAEECAELYYRPGEHPPAEDLKR